MAAHRSRTWLVVAAALMGCGGVPAAPPPRVAAPPAVTLAEVEAALLDAAAWRVTATIHAVGLIPVDVTASLLATADNRVRLDATGTFEGQPLDLHWVSDGARTTAGVATPPHLTEAIVIGLTRMGLLHNVARLRAAAAVPDHADGGVRTWVVALDPHTPGPGELGYRLEVEGHKVADTTVTIAPGPHGPVLTSRHIGVHFEGGEMTVDERYAFDLAATVDPDAFTFRPAGR